MQCGGPKTFPRTSFTVQIIFSFWSFEISEGILRNQKFIIGLDSFSNHRFIYLALLDNTRLCIDYPVESCKIIVFLFGSILPYLKGHGRGLISRNRGMSHPFSH